VAVVGDIVIIGAGPAGLTAAYELVRRGHRPTVLETGHQVGGLSRTVERDGWRFDIGGHRFFTRVPEISRLWQEILGPDAFPLRPRTSRILFRDQLFDYPLRAPNVLRLLGPAEATRSVLSYLAARAFPPRDQSHFEGWVSARFGRRLYRMFFKTYTEKVWGVPATEISAAWAAQRIKNLSLLRAALDALGSRTQRQLVTSLVDQFHYPIYGAGMMWEALAEQVTSAGARILLDTPVTSVCRGRTGAERILARRGAVRTDFPARQVISSMPLTDLVLAMDPPAPAQVRSAAEALRYRDFILVAVIVAEDAAFPDNWIYVHTPGVRVGRIQNFGAWSSHLTRQGRTCLGLEYFATQSDDLWSCPDTDLLALARSELETIGLLRGDQIQAGYVVRVPRAYPVYDTGYADKVAVLRRWLAEAVPNVHPVGRNGMHRYNNQDHSMYTAMLTVQNLLDGAGHDVWSVNVDGAYHESGPHAAGAAGVTGTGRAAPVFTADGG
jgi:protoporphyrinogen oxidase